MASITSELDTGFFGHPRGLSTLFFTEMWERFSYYGMRALLILYMTAKTANGGLEFDVVKASAIYGLYTAMVYLLSLPGGWVADQVLGQRKAVFYGGILIALGHCSLAVPSISFFYLGLVLIVTGTGLLKPNISVMVGQLYAQGDPRRDAGFSIFYMGINLGAFIAPLACGYLGQKVNWHLGFGLAAIGMTFGVVQYWLGGRNLGDAGLKQGGTTAETGAAKRQLFIGIALMLAAALIIISLSSAGLIVVTPQIISQVFGIMLLLIVVVFFGWLFLSSNWTPVERKRLIVIAVLFLAAAIFWSVFEQAGSTLNLFAERSTDKSIFGLSFPASWMQSLQPLFIITLAPVFAWIWMRLGTRNPSSPAKFALGLLFAGLGFAVLVGGAARAASGAQVSPLWLTVTYLLHTIGELLLSPVGLSAMTKLAPARIVSLIMGVWFLSLSVGEYMGARVSALYESLPLTGLLGWVAAFAIGSAIVLAMFVKPIKRLTPEVK